MSISVFLADDHHIVREGLVSYLNSQPDIRVIGEAGDGQEAVARIMLLVPDVAVLDIAMPRLDGIAAAKELNKRRFSTGIIILSMHATSEYVFRALDAGASGFVAKDSVGKELIDAVRAVYRGHRYLSQTISDRVIEDYVERRRTSEEESPVSELSDRERQILKGIVDGKTSSEIAAALSLSSTTINTYRSRLMKKLDIADIPSLVKFAIRHGLTDLD